MQRMLSEGDPTNQKKNSFFVQTTFPKGERNGGGEPNWESRGNAKDEKKIPKEKRNLEEP